MIDPDAAPRDEACVKERPVIGWFSITKAPIRHVAFRGLCFGWLRIRNAYGRRRPDGRGQLFLGTEKRSYGSSLSSLSITRQSGASLRS